MTRSLDVTKKTTEQNLIVCSPKSEAWVTIIADCDRGITLLTLTTAIKYYEPFPSSLCTQPDNTHRVTSNETTFMIQTNHWVDDVVAVVTVLRSETTWPPVLASRSLYTLWSEFHRRQHSLLSALHWWSVLPPGGLVCLHAKFSHIISLYSSAMLYISIMYFPPKIREKIMNILCTHNNELKTHKPWTRRLTCDGATLCLVVRGLTAMHW